MKICHEVIVILPGCTAEKSAVFFGLSVYGEFDGKQINDTGAGSSADIEKPVRMVISFY